MPNGSITIYKLIILYTLSKVDSPLPPGVISDYITDRGYTNYFNLPKCFWRIIRGGFNQRGQHLSFNVLYADRSGC